MKTHEIIIGVLLFAVAGAVLYVWGLKKSLDQGSNMERNLLHACGSRVVRQLKKRGVITAKEIETCIDGVAIRPVWSRNQVKVQDPKAFAPQVIAFLLDQQYMEQAADGTYRLRK